MLDLMFGPCSVLLFHVKATEKYFLTSSIYAVYIDTQTLTHIIHNVHCTNSFNVLLIQPLTHTKAHKHTFNVVMEWVDVARKKSDA